MNKKRLMAILAAGVLTATSFNPAMIKAESVSAEEAGMAVPCRCSRHERTCGCSWRSSFSR